MIECNVRETDTCTLHHVLIKFHNIVTLVSVSTFEYFSPTKTYVLTIWKTCCMVILIFLIIFVSYTLQFLKHFCNNFVEDSLEFCCTKETFLAVLTTWIIYWFKTKMHSTNYFSFFIQQIAHILARFWMMLFFLLVGLYHPLFRILMIFCYLFSFFTGNQKFKRHTVVIVGCWC